jgi:hypothetical protein
LKDTSCDRGSPAGEQTFVREGSIGMKRLLSSVLLTALALMLVPLSQAASPVTRTVLHFDGSGGDLQPCTGELMSPVGDIVLQSHEVLDENGGVHISLLVTFRNFTLTGFVSGDVYRAVNAGHTTINLPPGETTIVVTSGMQQVVGQGPDDFLLVILELSVSNANGELVVFPGPGTIKLECR